MKTGTGKQVEWDKSEIKKHESFPYELDLTFI